MKYYLQGRERFLQGAYSESMDYLEKALQLDPDAFTVLRLMGRVCFAASQQARGSMYLDRAQHLRPNDVEVNYLFGRYWLERKDFDRAVYYLMLAEDSPEQQANSTQLPLSAFYLARALQGGRYHRAAAAEFERFLSLAAMPVAAYRYDRELAYLIDEEWAAHLAAAENAAVVGDYAHAVPHYQRAVLEQPKDSFITSRLINALVRTGDSDAARDAAFAFLAQSDGSADAIKLLVWTYRSTGRQGQLIAELNSHLQASPGDVAQAVLTLAAAQDELGRPTDAFATLHDYLKTHPANLDVLGRLLKRVDSAPSFEEALASTAAALQADRAQDPMILRRFLPLAQSPAAATYLKSQRHPAAPTFATAYLEALTAREQNAPSATIDADFRDSLRLAPEFFPARDSYVRWLLAEEKFPQASQLVQEAVSRNPQNPQAWELLIQSEVAQNRLTSGLKLAQDARTKFPASPDVRLQIAAIFRLRGQQAEADAELNSLITDMPKFEPAYAALINALWERWLDSNDGPSSNLAGEVVTALSRLAREIPTSRYAQIRSALYFARVGRTADAESMLRRLLAETPDDRDILIPLAQLRQMLGRSADALATLQDVIKSHPSPELVQGVLIIYRMQDKQTDGLNFARKIMEQNPDNEGYAVVYAAALDRQEKKTDALAVLNNAYQRFPRSQDVAFDLADRQSANGDDNGAVLTIQAFMKANGETTRRLYMLAHYFTMAGDEDASAAALQRVLTIMPDHIGANNDLGYYWADAGVHLDQAAQMIHKAVDNRPSDSAYQDSAGWVLYKQGRFPQAVAALEKAIALPGGNQPDVMQHLGDALYRAGRNNDALIRWTQAREMLVDIHGLTPEEQKIRGYLDRAISDVRSGKTPTVSPVAAESKGRPSPQETKGGSTKGSEGMRGAGGAGEVGAKSADPTTSPSTLPQ